MQDLVGVAAKDQRCKTCPTVGSHDDGVSTALVGHLDDLAGDVTKRHMDHLRGSCHAGTTDHVHGSLEESLCFLRVLDIEGAATLSNNVLTLADMEELNAASRQPGQLAGGL